MILSYSVATGFMNDFTDYCKKITAPILLSFFFLTSLGGCTDDSSVSSGISTPTESVTILSESQVMPSTVAEANGAFEVRRKMIVQHWLNNLNENGIGDFESEGGTRGFKRITAGLMALKDEQKNQEENPDAANIYDHGDLVLEDFPDTVEAWTEGIYVTGEPGTPYDIDLLSLGMKEADYDFLMKEMAAILFLFKDDADLLTNQACFNIIDKGFDGLIGQAYGEWMRGKLNILGGFTIPETENHCIMTYTSIYLANQWIKENPRSDSRYTSGTYANANDFDNAGGEIEDFLLQATGRIVHNGFWEVNARPYQGMATSALITTYSYTDSMKIKTAFQNSLDYLAAKFAFQSFEGQRFAPYRRSAGYVKKVDIFLSDAIPFVMSILSGGYTFPDSLYGLSRYGHPSGYALYATLMNYRIPEPIHDFMLNRRTGWWARMQTRFTGSHYEMSNWPHYFEDGSNYTTESRGIESMPEFYFVTPDFLNVSGGAYNRYNFDFDFVEEENGVYDLDYLSRASTVLTPGVIGSWDDIDEMGEDVLLMKGNEEFWTSKNIGTYKNFTYGYYYNGSTDRHLDYPMTVPSSWEDHRYSEEDKNEWSANRVTFKFYNLTSVEGKNFYVVMARVSKSKNISVYRRYARGFWEIVPAERFDSCADLKKSVLANNPASQYANDTDGDYRHYWYTMTNGETLRLNNRVGDSSDDSILAIYLPGDDIYGTSSISITDYHYDRSNSANIWNTELMKVWEVDENYNFTGTVFASSKGDGIIKVNNPYIGKELIINSSDYTAPERTLVTH